MENWRLQPPFTIGSYFAQRLAMDGISEEEFLSLLGEPIESVCDRFPIPPAWLTELLQAFSWPSSPKSGACSRLWYDPEVLFVDLITPLLYEGCERLSQGVQELVLARADLPFAPDTVEDIVFANLPECLSALLSRTMVLELHVARLEGVLSGNTPEERFQQFLDRLGQPEIALALLHEYPVLARQLLRRINQWVTFSLEFLQHLSTDWEAIRATFSPESDPGLLVQIQGGISDSHRDGRSVLIATFSSGFQVVYKPRSLALDTHFQQLLTWVNERGDHLPFQTLQIADRETYGWVECVHPQSCTTAAEVWNFYTRQGGYLALLYALRAIDFHFENLMAVGEHPVLLDLEALFHPPFPGIDVKQADQLAASTINSSIAGTGLAPRQTWVNADSEGVDLSGLGGAPDQLTPFPVLVWEAIGTDQMRLTRKRVAMAGSDNRPTLNGHEVDVLDYIEAIMAGFTNMYRLLLDYREALLSENGPLACFAEDEIRIIIRNTQLYSALLRESLHPDLLRNALDRERLFDRLWAPIEFFPYLAKVIPYEREDLHKGDIPIFTTRPSSCDIWSSAKERITAFFDDSGFILARRRLEQLSEQDLNQQLWFIRASLATLAMETDQARFPRYCFTRTQTTIDRERLLRVAQAVGDRLETLALRGEHDVSWIGLALTHEGHWRLVPTSIDFYNGLPGIIHFLAYLGAMTGEERYTALARAALIPLQRQMEQRRSLITSIGGFIGWGGIIYTLAHLGTLWDQPALLDEAEEIVRVLPQLIEKDELLDMVGGAAGCIGGLMSLYRVAPSDSALAAMIQCGDHLIRRATPMGQGIGWRPKFGGTQPLSGFSHGIAGIAAALLELAVLTHEERFRTATISAIAYERSLFSPEAGNWLDLREWPASGHSTRDSTATFHVAWCHGAPGIGLAHVQYLRHLDTAEIRAEIDTALQTTLAQGFGRNHSLCHGDLGNLELLLQASQVLADPQWCAQVDRLTATIVENIIQHGWLCGVPLGVESPGLMTGLAGIGHELLRLAEPTRVPSVLVLEPPPVHV
jgi:type 2 lantibiotic biosynthesis protein LanM